MPALRAIRRLAKGPLLLLAASVPALPALAQGDWPNLDRRLGPAFHGVLQQAAQRLADGPCALVLDDFRDAHGSSLRERLAATGLPAGRYLESLYFLPGDTLPLCQGGGVYALAAREGRHVFVCQSRFAALARHQPGLAVTVVIHEALHTLGLGEDPPTSQEITAGVADRCGR